MNEDLPDESIKDGMLKMYLGEGGGRMAAAHPGKTCWKHFKQEAVFLMKSVKISVIEKTF